jgi:arabinofuranosyltransferase
MLCRLDLGFVVGPAMLAGYCSVGEKGKWKSAFLGLLPIIGWELFSLIYYGFLLPNTWYAKLSTGEDRWFLIGKGFIYLRDTLRHDPVTMGLILLGLLQVGGRGNGRQRWLLLGGLLYLAAVISAGGDFMRGPHVHGALCADGVPHFAQSASEVVAGCGRPIPGAGAGACRRASI